MSRVGQVIQTFRERFVQRTDIYALQQDNGKYLPVHQEVTDEVIRSHLKGEITIGLYPYADSTTTWICIDVDTREPDEISRIRSQLNTHGIPHLLEFSGNKGFHFWVFLDPPCQNWISRTFAKMFSDGHEIFPKQDQIARGGLGNLIKAPLGKHRLTGDWCLFVDEDLTDLDNPYEVLKEVSTIHVEEYLQNELPEAFGDPKTGEPSIHLNRPDPGPFDRIPLAKDCVQRVLIEGSDKGQRNATAIILATELRNRGVNQEGVEGVLKWVWNPTTVPHSRTKKLVGWQNPPSKIPTANTDANPKAASDKPSPVLDTKTAPTTVYFALSKPARSEKRIRLSRNTLL